jgi:hypothetical protein
MLNYYNCYLILLFEPAEFMSSCAFGELEPKGLKSTRGIKCEYFYF